MFQFPKQKIVFGPRQIVARINQDQVISPQITLWNQQGSEVIWGTLLVIPIEESLLYVRPLYLRSPEGRIPELKRVIVAYQSQIVMAETLQAGARPDLRPAASPRRCRRIGSQSSATSVVQASSRDSRDARPATPAEPDDERTWRRRRRRTSIARYKAQRDGDWATYGEEIKKVGDMLDATG